MLRAHCQKTCRGKNAGTTHESKLVTTAEENIRNNTQKTDEDGSCQISSRCLFLSSAFKWSKAIRNNNFTTCPGITESLVERHLPVSTATVQGHLHKEQHNLQSIRVKEEAPSIIKQDHDENDIFPPSLTPNVKKNKWHIF